MSQSDFIVLLKDQNKKAGYEYKQSFDSALKENEHSLIFWGVFKQYLSDISGSTFVFLLSVLKMEKPYRLAHSSGLVNIHV